MGIDLNLDRGQNNTSFIYRIECHQYIYIGQTSVGYGRLRTHLMNAYRNNKTEPIYDVIRKYGIAQTTIYIYTQGGGDVFYGLPKSMYDAFFASFKPNKGLDSKGNPQIDLNTAEILHILLATYQGYKVTNTSMGGYKGVSYTATKKGKDSSIKVLTQATTPQDALRLINLETKDLLDLAKLNKHISKVAFGDSWPTDYGKLKPEVIADAGLTTEEEKTMHIKWTDFLETRVTPAIIDTLVYFDRPDKLKVVKNVIETFVSGRGKVIGAIARQSGKLFDLKLNNTVRNMFDRKDSWKTITIYYTDDFNKVQDYMANAILNAVAGRVTSLARAITKQQWSEEVEGRKTKGHKKTSKITIVSGARSQQWKSLEHALNQGSLTGTDFENLFASLRNLDIINLTQWFNLDSLHMRGNQTDSIFQGIKPRPTEEASEGFKKDCSYRAFQYYFNECTKRGFDIYSIKPQYALENGVLHKAEDEWGGANAIFSAFQIEHSLYLNVRVKSEMAHVSYVCKHWPVYFNFMMKIYRDQHNLGNIWSMPEATYQVKDDVEVPVYTSYDAKNDMYLVYTNNFYAKYNSDTFY